MFDFLLSEAWWMDTIIAGAVTALITGVVTLLIALFGIKPKLTMLQKTLEKAEDIITKDVAEKAKGQTEQHAMLSREHTPIADAVKFLCDEKNKELGARNEARKSAFDVQKIVDELFAQSEKLLQATREVAALQAELTANKVQFAQLTAENAALRKELAQSRDPARDAWQEQTDEYDLEP